MSKVEENRRPKTGGRRKGTPNKMTAALKDMILKALDEAGGVDYLVQQSEETPTAFLALVGKVLPLQVNADVSATISEVRHRIIDGASD